MDIGGEGGLPALDHDGEQRSNLNISDVFEAISVADPTFGAVGAVVETAGAVAAAAVMARQGPPLVRIVEQPASKAIRFRYECEGRSAGSIPGVNSTQDRKTFPTIEICGHTGKAIVVVSCVTKDADISDPVTGPKYKPHPHNLVGKDRCNRGVCTLKTEVSPDNCLISLSNLGIQCVKRREIANSLHNREQLRVDPFRTGYSHRDQPQSIDLNAVRLCFQVFLPEGQKMHALPPVVSDIIYDKKAMCDLQILRVSRPSGYMRGGNELILLCEKVTREDIAVMMVEEGPAGVSWEEPANIIVVHKQVAIAFTTPPYRDQHTNRHVEVQIQLRRVSDNARSVGIPFTYVPETQEPSYLSRKRTKKLLTPSLYEQIEQEQAAYLKEQKPIKSEPSVSPHHMGGSPQPVYTPLEQALDNRYQQWMPEAMGMMGGNYYNEMWQGGAAAGYQGATEGALGGGPQGATRPGGPSPHVLTSPMPQHQMSPGHAMSPQHAMSPLHMSPGRQAVSPSLTMSPQGVQVMSPKGHMMDDRCGVMSHMASPEVAQMGHVSPILMQPPMPPQQQMETSSVASITNYLMDQGDQHITINSTELANYSAMLAQYPNELSDSLSRLSTGDLLNTAELQ